MLNEGVIVPSESEWVSPVVLAFKSDGKLRFCIDYRRLNAVTKRVSYLLPRTDDCMDSLGDANIFTTIDGNRGYWQLPVRKSDLAKTAFACHKGVLEFKRISFGLMNAHAL
eukprot:IDg10300t1